MRIFLTYVFILVFFGLKSQALTRKNVPFYINNQLYSNALTGGVNNAQISEGDLNADGLMDLLLFDRDGNVIIPMIYNAKIGRYDYYPDLISDLPRLKDWVKLLDYNKDGIIDIFTSSSNTQGIDGIEVYKGIVKSNKVYYQLQTNGKGNTVLKWPIGNFESQIYVSAYDIPAFDDIDEDGDIDILTFGNGATHVEWYRNISAERSWSLDSLVFVLESDCYGGFREGGFTGDIFLSNGPNQCNLFKSNTSRHSGSTVFSSDLNLDGLHDLLIGDISSNKLVGLFNNGSKQLAWMDRQIVSWPETNPVNVSVFPCAFEINKSQDGSSDILVTPNTRYISNNINNISLFHGVKNANDKVFNLIQNNFLVDGMLDFGAGTHPCFVDYNQDGLIDLLVGTEGIYYTNNTRDARLILFENRGTKKNPEFHLIDSNYLNFKIFSEGINAVYSFTPCFGDLDGDGDLDMLCGETNGSFFYSENIAGAGKKFQFKQAIYPYKNLTVYANSVPFLVDLNRDGLLDIVSGGRQDNNNSNFEKCSSFTYFQNQGSKTNPIFTESSTEAPNTNCLGEAIISSTYKSFSSPVFIDFKGKYKMFSGGLLGEINVFGNIEGNIYGKFTKVESNYGDLRDGETVHLSIADLDDDGLLDFVVGNYRGGLTMYSSDYTVDGMHSDVFDGSEKSTKVFPNPIRDMIYIQTREFELFTMELFNLHGISSFKIENATNSNIAIPASLIPGVYFLKLQFKSGRTYYERIIIE